MVYVCLISVKILIVNGETLLIPLVLQDIQGEGVKYSINRMYNVDEVTFRIVFTTLKRNLVVCKIS